MGTGEASATLQHWIWLAQQPQTWLAAALITLLVAVVAGMLTALMRRRRYVIAASLAVLAVLAVLVGVFYVHAFTVVRDALVSGGTDDPAQLSFAIMYLTGFQYLQYAAAVAAAAWLVWRASARRRA